MRGFYITIVLFVLLFAGGVINFLFINDVYEDINVLISEISSTPCAENEEKISRLNDYWENVDARVSISVSYLLIDEIENLIDSVGVYNQLNDATQLSYSLALLKNATHNIRRLEEFSIKNIL